jgi:putative transposase
MQGLTPALGRYRWSSYPATADLEPAPGFLPCERVLALFAQDRATAVHAYRAFVRDGLESADPKVERLGEIYLGDKAFVRRSRPRRPGSREVPRRQREPLRCSLEALLRERTDDTVGLRAEERTLGLP